MKNTMVINAPTTSTPDIHIEADPAALSLNDFEPLLSL